MPKIITSPVSQWQGTVTIADPLYLPQVEAIEAAFDFKPDGEKVWLSVLDKNKLPAIFACVEKWNLENFPDAPTLETFPLSPRPASTKLITWLWQEICAVYLGEVIVPNESSPTLSPTQAEDETQTEKSKSYIGSTVLE